MTPDCLDLSLYFFSEEVYKRIMNPPEVRNAQDEIVARPEAFDSLRTGLRANLVFKGEGEKTFTIRQTAPLFHHFSLPWAGNIQAKYCGPYFPSWPRSPVRHHLSPASEKHF